jgi:beta-lactamase class A
MFPRFSLFISFILSCQILIGQGFNHDDLENELLKIIEGKKATVGVAIQHIERGDTLTIHNSLRLPMQSVYKFPEAIAALQLVDKGELKLNQQVFVSKELAAKFSNSKLKERYPSESFSCSLEELIQFSVSNSDNLSCDVLFNMLGGPKKVNEMVKSWGYKDIQIAYTEIEMRQKISNQYKNYCKPSTMTSMLADFYSNKLLSKSSTDLLMRFMIESPTSSKRLKGLLPEGTVVAHKTGTGDSDKMIYALNDVGIITLPDGTHLSIAVFVKHSTESYEATEQLIAEITKEVYNSFVGIK